MRVYRPLMAGLAALAAVGLSGCTSSNDTAQTTPSSSPSPSAAVTPTAPPPQPAPVGDVPVIRDAGYADAVGTFGEDQVLQAVADHARIARIALADCVRWTTGEMDPQLASLVSPKLLSRVEQELQRPPGYPPSLLSNLPDDDGNGHDLAAAARSGCDGSAPMRYDTGMHPNAVHVDRSGAQPQLVQVASYAMTVTFGDTVVGAGQDWVLTSTPTATGWHLTDAEPSANVNWFPSAPS
ncbi:hypothetical protein [Geodermatophilus sp. FMUSA9-8]|uniref:hypothetical protein n=1 Tax=Geodermatophilus sp. FMUSA9-8 TaxID=3120155 RepID=UPI00300B0B5F